MSDAYVSSDTPLRWSCAEGHEWEAKPQSIIQGFWCRECNRGFGKSRRAFTIEIMKEMAVERGGECLSNVYDGIYTTLRWRCAAGHEWDSTANNVRRGGWCPECSHAAHGTLDRMRELARSKGGRCLSPTWNDRRQPLSFECAAGHRFTMRASVIKTGVWCAKCARP